MGASSSTEQQVSVEQREGENLAASTGALPGLQRAFTKLADPQTNTVPLESLQKCFTFKYERPIHEAAVIPESFSALLDHLGLAIVDLFFIPEKGGVGWVEFLKGYNKCCGRMSTSASLKILFRVFDATMRRIGHPSKLEHESDEDESKISGFLLPTDVLIFLWMCWTMSWNYRTSKVSIPKDLLFLPDISNLVFSAVTSCSEIGSGFNPWDCDILGLEVEVPIGKLLTWALKVVPNLPNCFTQFVHSRLTLEVELESSSSFVTDISSLKASSSNLLTFGTAWAISLTMKNSISEEIAKVCIPHYDEGPFENLLYRSSLHGRGLNRFWSNIEGYQGPLLVLISATSGDSHEGDSNARKWTIGALTLQGFENKDLYYGSSGNLYAITPVFDVFSAFGKEKNFVYSHLHPSKRIYEPHPKPVGIAFGGTTGNERIYIDEDFSRVTVRHHAVDKTYQHGHLFPDQGFLPVEASISEVEVWGFGGKGAKEMQDSYKKREELFTEQRRKVDLKTFASWEDSPEKMIMDLMSNPNAVRREDR